MDWSQYAVGGAASRPDSFTGLQPQFATGLGGMLQAAHAAGIPLQVTSAYRSPELQGRLYQGALAKYGSPEAARKWVAPPGRSQHNFGTAADFAVNGSLIRDANSPEAQWIRQNAANFGLAVPMDWEPWQVELAGARGQLSTRGGGTPSAVAADTGTALGFPQRNEGSAMMPPREKPRGLLQTLGVQKKGSGGPQGDVPFYQRDQFRDTAGRVAMAANTLRDNPDQNIPAAVMENRQRRDGNRTAEWLAQQPGGEPFAQMIASGANPAAVLMEYRKSQQPAATFRQVRGSDIGMTGESANALFNVGPDGKISGIGGGGTSITNVMPGGQPQAQIGTIPPGYQAVPDGAGGFTMSPVPGSEAALELDRQADKGAAAAESAVAGSVNVLAKVNDVRAEVSGNPFASGILGVIAGNIPGTGAYDASKTAGTIKANLGFDRLTQMRAESPTGGALGAVSQIELDRLESSISSLDLGQSKERILQNLNDIERQYTRILNNAYRTGDPARLDAVFGERPEFVKIEGTTTAPTGGATPTISSDAEYDALPSGATFVDPNGITRRKP